MNLYVLEYGSKISTESGKVRIEREDNIVAEYPVEILESLTLSSKCQITSQCIEKLSRYGVSIMWVGFNHSPIGVLTNPGRCNIIRQKRQFEAQANDGFSLAISRGMISAKVNNQRVILQRHCRDKNDVSVIKNVINELKLYIKKIDTAETDEILRGYEGYCSKRYFDALREIVPERFAFDERTKNPPRDRFSALLSFLYSLLFNEIMICVTAAGLNPYVGFMHELRNNHPALVSDMMEEWRGVIADSIAIRLVKSGTVSPEDFEIMQDGAVYLNRTAAKKVIASFEKKLGSENEYLRRDGFGNTYRASFGIQTASLCEALEENNPLLYTAVRIR